MSEVPSSISSTAFADALARARQLAAKLSSGASAQQQQQQHSPPQMPMGIKRSAGSIGSNDSEPDTKRLASLNDPFGAQLAAMKHSGGGGGGGSGFTGTFTFPVGMGITGSGKACMEEVRIPDGLVGLIIGRGGEQVSRIQAETACKVQVAPDSDSKYSGTGKDRPCYLQGTKESIEKAKDLIMEIVNSKSHEISRPGLGSSKPGLGAGPGMGPNPPGTASIEMVIPGAKVGLVIGKGGETIRSLQDKSGTKMYILQENMFEECDKPLRIVGEPDLVEHARQLVMDLINDTPPKSDFFKPKNEYGDRDREGGFGGGGGGGGGGGSRPGLGLGSLETMKFPVPKISVGLIIGKGGEMIKKIQQETGAKVQFDPVNQSLGDMDEQLAIITGKTDQIRLAQLKIEELVETALHGPQTGGGGGRGGGGPGGHHERRNDNWGGPGGGGGGHGGGHRPRGDQDEERMTVPVGRVGMVIGKGGETIRAINQQSGAHSEIDRNGPNDGPERIFVIRGSRQQIEHAKSLIMEKVNTLPPKGGGHHSNGPGGHDGYGQQQSQGWGQQQQQYGGPSQGQGQWGQQSQGQGQPGAAGGDTQAQWAAYYAQYYSQAQAAPAQAAAAQSGSADYTQQWIEYLRAQGQNQQADLLESQMKGSKGTNGGAPEPPGTVAAAPGAGGSNGSAVPAAVAAGQNGQQSADYSQQWADHYRSVGKIAEAEQIENYIKAQKASQAGGQPTAPVAAAGPTPGDPAYQNYYNQYYQQYYGGAGPGGASNNGAAALPPGTEGD